MKLIIDISDDVYTRLFDNGIQDNEIAVDDVCEIARALRKGTPLDDVKAEIEDLGRFYDNDYFSGNRDSMFKCNEVMQILNNIGKESEDT